jgi:pimeloyl-ACP methyl ester carboxylesterase
VLDNPFSVAITRADKAGLVLADALINKAQGERPVTLIGYSMGARVIFSCLISLAERKAFGLVESAVLIGSPCPSDVDAWCALRSVVAGRLVNVYSENDYILAFLYRTSSIQFGVAGLQPAENSRVENVDLSSIVSGHLRYSNLITVTPFTKVSHFLDCLWRTSS